MLKTAPDGPSLSAFKSQVNTFRYVKSLNLPESEAKDDCKLSEGFPILLRIAEEMHKSVDEEHSVSKVHPHQESNKRVCIMDDRTEGGCQSVQATWVSKPNTKDSHGTLSIKTTAEALPFLRSLISMKVFDPPNQKFLGQKLPATLLQGNADLIHAVRSAIAFRKTHPCCKFISS